MASRSSPVNGDAESRLPANRVLTSAAATSSGGSLDRPTDRPTEDVLVVGFVLGVGSEAEAAASLSLESGS